MRRATTLRQWKAFEACVVEGLSQTKAAAKFGVSQAAISQRIRRYIEITGVAIYRAARRRSVTVVSLSQCGDE